jgi:hypothetical protein
MKIRLRLGDADRARYDCPEWIEVDPYAIQFKETIAIQAGVVIEGVTVAFDTPQDWRAALSGRPVLGADGQPVMVPRLDDDGSPVLDEQGQPAMKAKVRADHTATLVLVWLALRRAGAKVGLADVDFDSDSLTWDVVLDPEDDPAPDAEGNPESGPAMTS